MIIDGVEVLYTMRNGKIVDPNIPTDGLICYLDARGKTNNDIYRNTLLDLSGSGNHGTLQNFNFTEESGYVKDLSGGTSGLVFDGVDDVVSIIKSLQRATLIIDFKINSLKTIQNNMFLSVKNLISFFYNITYGTYFVDMLGDTPSYNNITTHIGNLNDIKKVCFTLDQNNIRFKINNFDKTIPSTNKQIEEIYIGNSKWKDRGSNVNFKKLYLYNRVLTDEEITQLMEG